MTTKFSKDNLERYSYSKETLNHRCLPWSENGTKLSEFDKKLRDFWVRLKVQQTGSNLLIFGRT